MHGRTIPSHVFWSALAAAFALTAAPAFAGSICGTVRDAQTTLPVSNAAVFLFDDLDQYTGLYAGTDLAGHYCIDNVPSGTYTLQVRVDDYLAAVVRNVVVSTTTGVDIAAAPRFFLDQPWPNPASRQVFIRLGAPAGDAVTLEVFDAQGRRVMGWRGDGPGAGGRTLSWDFRDTAGSAVASGVYFVRLRSEHGETIRRFVHLR